MSDDAQVKAATEEELTRRCGHECLRPPDHEGLHQYGYILGPYSYEGLLAELRESRERERRLREGIATFVKKWEPVDRRPDYWTLRSLLGNDIEPNATGLDGCSCASEYDIADTCRIHGGR